MPSRLSFAFTIAAALLSTPLAAAADEGLLLAPTPLVLKDGRIAQVTIHTIRFPLGKDEPEATERQALAGLVEELATDCFLTAQAVGHVEPGPGSDGETLAAHRLARARADRVQAALTGRGLPAGSIASVWDWQFAVREPRVTLWVFRLAEGDDCDSQPIAADGTPATGDRTPVTADAAQPAQPPAEAAPERMAVVEAEALPQALQASEDVDEPLPVAAAVDAAAPEAGEPQLAGTVPHEAGEPQLAGTVSHETGEPQLTGAGPSGAAGSPEVMPPEVQAADAALAAATEQAPEVVARVEQAAQAGPADPTLAITFDVNSSYFPKGAGSELKALVGGLEPHRTYEAVLEGAVSAEALRNGGEKDGHAYNRWIADRRMERVADWLRQSMGRSLSIRHDYVENDSSRRVTVKLHPLP